MRPLVTAEVIKSDIFSWIWGNHICCVELFKLLVWFVHSQQPKVYTFCQL